jgi:hypothetical protein
MNTGITSIAVTNVGDYEQVTDSLAEPFRCIAGRLSLPIEQKGRGRVCMSRCSLFDEGWVAVFEVVPGTGSGVL